jgi:hypothetical protein
MCRSLWLHTSANLRYYFRSRLVLGAGLTALAIWGLGLVPMFLLESSGSRFEQLKWISMQTRQLAWFCAAALGLAVVSTSLRNHHVRLVFTRPGSRETWLASVFLSACLVSVAIHAAGALLTLGLSLAWSITFQPGFVFLAVQSMFSALVVVSMLTALGTVLHPMIAVLFAVFFNESVFRYLDTWLLGTVQANHGGILARTGEWAANGLYRLLPMLDPFAWHTAEVETSLRVTAAQWGYLAAGAGYAILASAFFFLLSATFVRRKRLV